VKDTKFLASHNLNYVEINNIPTIRSEVGTRYRVN